MIQLDKEISMKRPSLLLPLAAVLTLLATPLLAQDKRTALSLETAKKIAAACEQKAKTEGWKMNIAIMDAGAESQILLAHGRRFPGQHQSRRTEGQHLGDVSVLDQAGR